MNVGFCQTSVESVAGQEFLKKHANREAVVLIRTLLESNGASKKKGKGCYCKLFNNLYKLSLIYNIVIVLIVSVVHREFDL